MEADGRRRGHSAGGAGDLAPHPGGVSRGL